MGYNPNISHLYVGYSPFTNHLLTAWDIQALVYRGPIFLTASPVEAPLGTAARKSACSVHRSTSTVGLPPEAEATTTQKTRGSPLEFH